MNPLYKNTLYPLSLLGLAAILAACMRHEEPPADGHVISAEERARLTPD